jgi:hypothetical protein
MGFLDKIKEMLGQHAAETPAEETPAEEASSESPPVSEGDATPQAGEPPL